MNQFQGLRLLAQKLERSVPLSVWKTRPVEASTHVASELLGVELTRGVSAEIEAMYRTVFINVLTCGLWAANGRPVVTLGHKTAAACAATQFYGPEALDMVRSPWPAFMVRLPVPFLTIEDAGVTREAGLLLVTCLPESMVDCDSQSAEPKWWFKLCADSPAQVKHVLPELASLLGTGVSLWGFNLSTRSMADKSVVDADWTRWDSIEVTGADNRVEELTKRLVLNVCAYIESPNSGEKVSSSHVTVSKRRSKPDELGTYDSYEVRAGIKLNLCDALREYVQHGRKAPTYARLVTPHWKRVVHGEGRALRRLQYIEAYWKGVDG